MHIEPNDVLKDFTERLERIGVPYMLTGSMAMMYYATPRYTADIDIIVELKAADAHKFPDVFSQDYYFSETRMRDSIDRRTMFNLVHENSSFKVDCIIRKENDFQKNAFENKTEVNYQGFKVWIISLEDLILSKLLWGKDTHSEFQKRDIVNLLRRENNEEYLIGWAEKLDVVEFYEQCLLDR